MESNASNEESSPQVEEQVEEGYSFYDPIEYAKQWFNRDRELTPEQRAHVAKRTAFKARLEAEAEARWGAGSEEA